MRIEGIKILKKLGKGGMAEVYSGIDEGLSRIVAVKVLLREVMSDRVSVERFHREAKIIARLKHPNIVEIYRSGYTQDKRYFIVLEYMKHGDLERFIRERKPPLKKILEMLLGVFDALYFMHSKGIVHRDLKPSNILVSEHEVAKISDFGIAGFLWGGGTTRLTKTGSSFGTVSYMAPEQLIDAKRVDHRADIYSMGVILYEIATGKLPVGAVRNPSELNPSIPKELSEIIMKAISQEKFRRFPSIKTMKEKLKEAIKYFDANTKLLKEKEKVKVEETVAYKEESIEELLNLIKNGTITERLSIKEKFLGKIQDEHFPLIKEAIKNSEGIAKEILILALSKIKKTEAVEVLKELLKDPFSRENAILALGEMNTDDSLSALETVLDLPCKKMYRAIKFLIKKNANKVREKSVECLYSHEYDVKKEVLEAIEESGDKWFLKYLEDFIKKEKEPELIALSKRIIEKLKF